MKKILVADDDPAICDALSLILEDAGYYVITTLDGNSIKEMTHAFPDLFILDIWMSGVDGRDICKQLKAQKHTEHIPIIMISASRDVIQSTKEVGANDFLAKPFNIQDLLTKVEQYI